MFFWERRKVPRQTLAMPVRLRKLAFNRPATVSDLSTLGCKLDLDDLTLDVGNRVLIRPNGLESLLGTIVWSQSRFAGVQFDEPLRQVVVDRFCELFPETKSRVELDIAV